MVFRIKGDKSREDLREFVNEELQIYELAQYPMLYPTGKGGWFVAQIGQQPPKSTSGTELSLIQYVKSCLFKWICWNNFHV